jgi:hypothetical protein
MSKDELASGDAYSYEMNLLGSTDEMEITLNTPDGPVHIYVDRYDHVYDQLRENEMMDL